ncbi:hypothetical protein AX16_003553 [Volvariella volvacea WC 439]|nr:hypothetical protein AX16_003553 [Volvariella volvacea WC 439]
MKLCRLESFQFRHPCRAKNGQVCRSSPRVLDGLRSIIEKNPSLHTLEYRDECQFLSLQDIFPSSLISMALQKLSIDAHFLPAPNNTTQPFSLPNLSHLQHLDLRYNGENTHADADQLWIALAGKGVALKRLTTAYISPSLLEYLASFGGLEECCFRLSSNARCAFSTASVYHALSPHASSLKKLHIALNTTYLPMEYDGFAFSLSSTPGDNHDLAWIQPITFPQLHVIGIITLDNVNTETYDTFGGFFSNFPTLSSIVQGGHHLL